MNNIPQQLSSLLYKISGLGFWKRVFHWRSVQQDLVQAASLLSTFHAETSGKDRELNDIQTRLSIAGERNNQLQLQQQRLASQLDVKEEKLAQLQREIQQLKELNLSLEKEDAFRRRSYASEVDALTQLQQSLKAERDAEKEEIHRQQIEQLESLKETWRQHEQEVNQALKQICLKHNFPLVDKVSFKGEPDNVLLVAGEHLIFDAKSPAGTDLKNFPHYLKSQAELSKKYAKQEGVRKEIFLVVPVNTLGVIKQFVYNMADYDVFIISVDALEPVLLSLFKIEDYEFAEQLSPEERDNICRIIGKFAHLSKRRIQIDSFFARQFIELAYKAESSLPADVHEKVLEFERSEKLNPPLEKRAKAINTQQLANEQQVLEAAIKARGVKLPDEEFPGLLNGVELYE